ncbi:hypothetical protein NQ317_017555 [Molorchus minor]|uniref:General transcription factor 3C polypeptide 5 n=1 Tax=Molorchus minor TaxID=1323400 RepID=A0ABQ9J0G1_9CUCU|nr:hypothetical protein NQ317_017555 [Molorchus minor]
MCESAEENTKSRKFVNKSSKCEKKKPIKEPPDISDQTNIFDNTVDPVHSYNYPKKIVRVEYPGFVKNVSKAIETLGGMHGIEMVVADPRNKLELRFHIDNKYNKPCSADRDLSPGILIKIKPDLTESSNTNKSIRDVQYSYEIVGLASLNFKFNRLCDFQYLPVVSNEKDCLHGTYIHNKILPKKSTESVQQPKYFITSNFSRFDSSQNKLYLHAGEKFGSSIRPELAKFLENCKAKKTKYIPTKQVSVFVNFQIPNVQVPDQPLSTTMDIITERDLQAEYKAVKKLFEERPIWTKTAIQYKTGLSSDHAKIVLPAVSYFCPTGPWRMTWVRFEYNPQKDFNSRIYQILDYRIRASEGTKLKVDVKRGYAAKTVFYLPPSNPKKVSLQDNEMSPKQDIGERNYILKPNYIPPARQMFYQYCDIHIPEIQGMLSRLPKLPANAQFNPKTGWLPTNFAEQCREIVNRYVMDQVQKELLEDTIKLQKRHTQTKNECGIGSTKDASPTYCSKMLSNIKKGIYQTVHMVPSKDLKSGQNTSESINTTINLTEDTDELDQINAEDVFNSLPETMDENSDDEILSQGSDLDIDMEAVEEVNKMIGVQEEEINVVTSYLKNKI